MENPAGLTYAKVVGRYLMFMADSNDAGDLPDFVPFEGTGTITPDLIEARNTNPGLTGVYLPDSIPITLVDGHITQGGQPWVMLLRGGPGVTPQDFTYRIRLKLRPTGSTGDYIDYGPFSFAATPDIATGVVDLAIVTPITASSGIPSIVGPPGPQGAQGAAGVADDASVKTLVTTPGSQTAAALSATYAPVSELATKAPLFTPRRAPQPLVVFTFDDNPRTDWTVVKAIFDEKSVKGVIAAVTSWVSTSTNLTWAELRQFQSEGWEISNHSKTHTNLTGTPSAATITAEVSEAHGIFLANGVTPGGFTYAYGTHGPEVRDAVSKLYPYGASVGSGQNKQPFKSYALGRKSFNNSTTLATHQAEVDAAIANNEVLIYLTHSVAELDATAQQKMRDLIDYIKAKPVPIVTLAEAMKRTGNLMEMGDYVTGTNCTVVDGSGKIYSADITAPAVFTRSNAITNATTPETFYGTGARRVYFDVLNTINNPAASGFPHENTMANVRTEILGPDAAGAWALQQFTSSNGVWIRRVNGTIGASSSWAAWTQVASAAAASVITRSNSITFGTLPIDFYITGGRRVYFDVLSTANNPAASGFPHENTMANVRTEVLGPDAAGAWVLQTFTTDLGVWSRRAGGTISAGTAWGAFTQIASGPAAASTHRVEGYTGSAETQITRPPSAYSTGTTLSQIPNTGGLASAPGPTGSSTGLLETVKAADNYFVKQTFTAIPGGNKYERVSTSSAGSSWTGAWKQVTLT